jgi:hypothetical protein
MIRFSFLLRTQRMRFSEGTGDGVFVNALNPGAILTNLQKHVGGKLITPPEKQKTVQQRKRGLPWQSGDSGLASRRQRCADRL